MTFVSQWDQAAQLAHRTAVEKGFWETGRNDGEAIALCHSELSEALEALRNGNQGSKTIPGYPQVAEELADLVIRVMDLSVGRHWDVAGAIVAKMMVNAKRPHKHGKEF